MTIGVDLDPGTLCATGDSASQITFTDRSSPAQTGARISMLSPREDLDRAMGARLPRNGWYWYEDSTYRQLVYRLQPTESDLLTATWDLAAHPLGPRWIERMLLWDEDDRRGFLRDLLALGADLVEDGITVDRDEVSRVPARVLRELAAYLRGD